MVRLFFAIVILVVTGFAGVLAQSNFDAGAAFLENEQYDEARRFFAEANAQYPNNAEVQYYLGRLALVDEAWDEAIELLTRATELDPLQTIYYRWLGDAYIEKLQVSSMLKKRGFASKAKESYMQAVAVAPNNVDSRQSLIEFYLEAPGIAGGSKEKALENIEVVQTLDVPRGHRLMAYYYRKTGEWEAAEGEYLALAAMDPADPEPYYRIGAMYQGEGMCDEAVAAFEQCLEIEGNYPNGLYQIGRCAVMSGGNVDRGIECLQIYLTLQPGEEDPSLAWAHVRLGMLYEKQRRFAAAEAEYEAALELDPDLKEAKTALKKVQRR